MKEGIPPIEKDENHESVNAEKALALKEMLFHEIISAKIVDTYEKEIEKNGLTDIHKDELREKIINMTPADREAFYAFPWELKQRALPVFASKILKGEETIDSFVDKIVEVSKKQHRKLGFHASSESIFPKEEKSGAEKALSWNIYGKEKDHRDDDLPMAYYSFDYNNLYRIKRPNFIYIVSIQEGEKYGHRKDGKDEWGRAPSLSIIDKVDLRETDETIDQFIKEETKKGHQNYDDPMN